MAQSINEQISRLKHELAIAKSDIRYYQDYIDKLEAYYRQPWYVRVLNRDEVKACMYIKHI